jgi:hypothetical protein
MERLLRGAGLASDEAQAPEYLPLLVAARRSALAQAGRQFSVREVDENDDEEIDRGIIAQAELPPGVPMWPPRVFLARERTYTKGWHKWLLKQGEFHRSETDRRIAEGDMLSVVALWLDYSALTDKLALSAEDDGDPELAWALAKVGMAYRDAAYQAVRMRVDQVTLDLISRPVSEMYTWQNRMELETVTVRPEGLRMLREFNKATVTARTKHAATKAAAVPPGPTDDRPALSQRAQKAQAAAAKKEEEAAAMRKREEGAKRQKDPKASKNTQGAAGSAADTSGRGQPAGGQ